MFKNLKQDDVIAITSGCSVGMAILLLVAAFNNWESAKYIAPITFATFAVTLAVLMRASTPKIKYTNILVSLGMLLGLNTSAQSKIEQWNFNNKTVKISYFTSHEGEISINGSQSIEFSNKTITQPIKGEKYGLVSFLDQNGNWWKFLFWKNDLLVISTPSTVWSSTPSWEDVPEEHKRILEATVVPPRLYEIKGDR